jgi:tetratricopeptide (TPR) repeat protein
VIAGLKPVWALLAAAPWIAAAADLEARQAAVVALLDRRDYGAALEAAAKVNRERPDDLAGYRLLAYAHLGLGNYKEAEEAVQWMLDLRLGRADAQGWLAVAEIREVTGDFDGALEVVNLAYRTLPPGSDRERVALLARAGRLCLLMNKPDAAEQSFTEALAADASDVRALEAFAEWKIARGRPAEARAVFERLARATGHPSYLYRAARLQTGIAAYKPFERAARERMADIDNANRELALYYAGPGKRPADGLALARREAERRRDVWTLHALAVALRANGKLSEARQTLRPVMQLGTRYPEILATAAALGLRAR